MTAHDETAVGQQAYRQPETVADDRTVEADSPSRVPPPASLAAAVPGPDRAASPRAESPRAKPAPVSSVGTPAVALAAAPSDAGPDLLAGELAGAFGAMFASPEELPPPKATTGLDFGEESGEAATVRSKSPLAPFGLRTGLDQSFEGFGGLFNEGPEPALPAPKVDEGEPEWHAAIDEEDVGPLTLGQLRSRIQSGEVDQETLVWREGMDDWTPAGEVREVRSLFSDLPRRDAPRVAAPAPQTNTSAKAAGPSGWADPSDPFGAVPGLGDSSEGSWQPHGLTAVYQAANLAEAAAVTKPPPAPPGRKIADDPDDDISWKPGAGNALASLVSNEIGRLDGPAFSESSLPPAADDSLALKLDLPLPTSAPPLAEPAGLGLAPLATGAAAPLGGSMPPLGGVGPVSGGGAAAFVAPAAPLYKNPLVIVGGLVVSLFAITMMLIAVKLLTMESGPVVAQAPAAAPATAAATAVVPAAVPASEPPPVPTANAPTDPPPSSPEAASAAPSMMAAAEPAASPEGADGTPAGTAPGGSGGGGPAPAAEAETARAEARVASAPPAKKTRATQTARRQQAKPRAEPAPAPAKSRACDPVLDLDCDEKPARTAQSPAQKTTLSPSDVLGVIKQNKDVVDSCAARYGAKGTLKMEWRILKSGNTSSVRVASPEFVGTPVGTCVEAAVKKWKFPAYSGSAPPPVKFPFKLKGS